MAFRLFLPAALFVFPLVAAAAEADLAALRQRFIAPPASAGTVTLWWLNGKLTPEAIREQMLNLRDKCGFGGVAPLTMFRMKPATEPAYLSDEYFRMYGIILDTAKELGMSVVFYDDCDYPSGTAGNRMRDLAPDDLLKYLARAQTMVSGPGRAELSIADGAIMSVVAREAGTGERRVVTREARWAGPAAPAKGSAGSMRRLAWDAPAGQWQVQAFVCATAPARRFVDPLDPESMRKFIALTYDRFAERFGPHFGTTIRMTFFDDLAAYHAPDAALWTPKYNEKFKAARGFDPEALYPALWEDIGPDTQAARAQLLGFRNELYSKGYPAITQQWCDARNMKASGHPAASYRPNPLQSPGDAILFYRHQGYPLTDYIHYYHQGIDGFKVPSSAAYNFDQELVVCEIYGNFSPPRPTDASMLYRAGMEMYARGINYLLPHGSWWDEKNVATPPEISWRSPALGAELPAYNRWAARCETLLRGGRHVADVAMVYPIADLSSRYTFNMRVTNGREALPGTDYYELMRLLTGELRRDFTLLHPQTIDERCTVEGGLLKLNNAVNHEQFPVLILPACRTIPVSTLRKAKQFLDAGGHVIATTCLPEKSAEIGQDAVVRELSAAMFGEGKRGIFIPRPDEKSLRSALDGLGLPWDVTIANAPPIPARPRSALAADGKPVRDGEFVEGGNRQLGYIHRALAGAEVYYFANSSDLEMAADVTVRGRLACEWWDPHTGELRPAEVMHAQKAGAWLTTTKLRVAPVRSVFLVGRP